MKSQRKDHMQQQFLFEMTNELTINFIHGLYTNFNGDKLSLEKPSIILIFNSGLQSKNEWS